jgi:ribosome recycling factor
MSDFEVKMLRHDLAAAETEIREVRRKILEKVLELFKDPDMAKKDIERVIKGML